MIGRPFIFNPDDFEFDQFCLGCLHQIRHGNEVLSDSVSGWDTIRQETYEVFDYWHKSCFDEVPIVVESEMKCLDCPHTQLQHNSRNYGYCAYPCTCRAFRIPLEGVLKEIDSFLADHRKMNGYT